MDKVDETGRCLHLRCLGMAFDTGQSWTVGIIVGNSASWFGWLWE
jgi:hypothetical protein